MLVQLKGPPNITAKMPSYSIPHGHLYPCYREHSKEIKIHLLTRQNFYVHSLSSQAGA